MCSRFGSLDPAESALKVFVAASDGNLFHWNIKVTNDLTAQKGDFAKSASNTSWKIAICAVQRSAKSALVTCVNYLCYKNSVIVSDRCDRLHVFQVSLENPNADVPFLS